MPSPDEQERGRQARINEALRRLDLVADQLVVARVRLRALESQLAASRAKAGRDA